MAPIRTDTLRGTVLVMADAALTTIDPDGDVLLEFIDGKSKACLRVSSKVLSLVSPVFAAMFKSPFKEGHAHAQSPSEALVIPLPEDDLHVFTILCMAFHHRMDEVPSRLSATCLEKLAAACDKYDFAPALKHSSMVWLNDGVKGCHPDDHMKLLCAAYALDAAHAFARISWSILSELRVFGAEPVTAKGVGHDLQCEARVFRPADSINPSISKRTLNPTLRCPLYPGGAGGGRIKGGGGGSRGEIYS